MSMIFNLWQKGTNLAESFGLSTEKTQQLTMVALNTVYKIGDGKLIKFFANTPQGKRVDCLGMTFKHPFGLAAGLDKNGDYLKPLTALGFSFLEVGTVTPLSQKGMDHYPRIVRDLENKSMSNNIGIENKGIVYVCRNLKSAKNYFAEKKIDVKIGLNITFNKINSNDANAIVKDYVRCIDAAYNYVDYFVLNISCPNYQSLDEDTLNRVLIECKKTQKLKTANTNKKVPLLIKIAPTRDGNKVDNLLRIANQLKYEGIIATNAKKSSERGGNSGEKIDRISTQTIKSIRVRDKDMPIIASGGCVSWANVERKLNSGANLVQVMTGISLYGHDFLNRLIKNHREL